MKDENCKNCSRYRDTCFPDPEVFYGTGWKFWCTLFLRR